MAERESHDRSYSSSVDTSSLGSNRNKVVTKKTTTVVPVSLKNDSTSFEIQINNFFDFLLKIFR